MGCTLISELAWRLRRLRTWSTARSSAAGCRGPQHTAHLKHAGTWETLTFIKLSALSKAELLPKSVPSTVTDTTPLSGPPTVANPEGWKPPGIHLEKHSKRPDSAAPVRTRITGQPLQDSFKLQPVWGGAQTSLKASGCSK